MLWVGGAPKSKKATDVGGGGGVELQKDCRKDR